MLRWIRNIILAFAVAIVVVWVLYLIANRSSPMSGFDFPIEILQITLVLMGLGGVLTIVLWALGLTRLNSASAQQQSMIVLTYLEQAVRLNLPLPAMLSAAAESEPGWVARRIERLRMHIAMGSSIADALRQAMPGSNRRAIALVQAAERTGRIGPELTRLVREQQNNRNRNLGERSFIRSYPAAMAMVIPFIVSLIMIFVMPKFQQIFKDFRVPLPPLTVALMQFCNFFAPWGFAVVLIVALLAIILQTVARRMNWPGRWFTTNRDLSDICHVIGGEMDAGLPMDAAIRGASELSIGKSMRDKLRAWADGIDRGLTAKDAAIDAKMPKLIAGLATTSAGFEFLSRYYAGKFSRLTILLRAAVIPAMVFVFGIIVAIVALSLFLPLISLIDTTGRFSGRL
jgi:type II secretory pathway component PulF